MKTQPTTYRLRRHGKPCWSNWKDYTAALQRRGSLTLWMEEDLAALWLLQEKSGKPGASRSYSDKAIEICLSLRVLLKLPLRQTQGFVRSVMRLAGLSLPVPDYTTLCRRQRSLPVRLPVRPRAAARHIVLDSTGLKVFGEGECEHGGAVSGKVRKHGKAGRRVWKKVHLAVDEATGEVRVQARLRWQWK